MASLTANELKRGGVTALEKAMLDTDEDRITIEVRGKPKYMILEIAGYNAYREYELDKAIMEAEADYTSGKFDTVDDFEDLAQEILNNSK